MAPSRCLCMRPLLLGPCCWALQQPWRKAGREPGTSDRGLIPPVPHPHSHRLPASCPMLGTAPQHPMLPEPEAAHRVSSQHPVACGGLGPAGSSLGALESGDGRCHGANPSIVIGVCVLTGGCRSPPSRTERGPASMSWRRLNGPGTRRWLPEQFIASPHGPFSTLDSSSEKKNK